MSLINTRLTNFRANSPLDKWETRASRYGGFELFKRQKESPTGIITEDLEAKARAAVGSVLEVPVIDREGFTIQNITQPVTITGGMSTSQLYTVSFINYYFGFRIFPGAHVNNHISMQREFNTKLKGYALALLNALDTAAIAALEASKSQVLADDLGGRYALVSNVVEAPLAEEGAVMGDINPLFGGNDFADGINIVANGSTESLVRNKLLEKGQFNTDDKTYQYADKNFFFTNRLANGVGHKATMIAVQDDAVGFVQQFSPDSLLGNQTSKHVWDIEELPIAGLKMSVFQYDDAIDGSALSGAASAHLTATKAEFYGFHTGLALITPYNSDPATIASPIMKVAVKTT